MPGRTDTPVAVRGDIDEPLGRWRWLVKWFLVIPHLVVLFFLWVAFFALTFVAGVSIAFTGRYPAEIFDFNVGVLRWTWRVNFYAFTLGTDRYPPFSLAPDPTYPAELAIERPAQLSRGLVWVKWWLLAIPQYLVVAAFAGGANVGIGLIGILALIAGVTLAVKQHYPRSIFDFVMGMHRWCWRVVAYAALMTDLYPPFRLDPGPDEPGAGPEAPPADPPLAA
jgi:Domain of unknown function (DUF4389)